MPSRFAGIVLALIVTQYAGAANFIIYDDQTENGFDQGCSFPSPSADFDFVNTTVVHSGTHSIRFTPDHNNAVSWCTPATYSAATDYNGIDFWVNGGTTGAQNVNLVLGLAGNPVAQSSLTALQGIPLAANLWVHFQVSFTAGALTYNGSFDQISLQDESGAVQASMYFDDVALIPAAAAPTAVQNAIFADSFEPEYMLVPQFGSFSNGFNDPSVGSGIVKVYQRTVGTNNFILAKSATVGGHPNGIAFAPDGNVWVLDGVDAHLRRYTLQALLSAGVPTVAPDKDVGPVGNGSGIFEMAFFGDYAYVSQSDFGATNQILKFSIANLNAQNNTSTVLASGGFLSVPAGLAFDAYGMLWIANDGNSTVLRMNPTTGSIVNNDVNSHSLSTAEGLAFDQYGSLWVGNNGSFVLPVFADWQLNGANFSAEMPIYQITTPSASPHPGPGGVTGEAGGLAFDHLGYLWANYEYSWSVLGYSLESLPRGGALPGVGNYTSAALPTLSNATTDPGHGGIAFWPVPSTIHR